MKRISVLYGIEKSFPQSVIDYINENFKGIKAEELKIGSVKINDKFKYDVILDRVSHLIPFYQTYLKAAVVAGSKVINDPFTSNADNNFYHSVLSASLKINTPKSVIIPSKELPEGTIPEMMHNLIYPLDWDDVFNYIGFPAYLKPNIGHAPHTAYKIYNQHEFFSTYDLTGRMTMILQENIEYEEYFRVFTIGKKESRVLRYDPIKPLHLRYYKEETIIDDKLRKELEKISLKICNHFNYDFNSSDIAIKEGKPYVIDWLNNSPVCDKEFLFSDDFKWLVEKTSNFLISLVDKDEKSVNINVNVNKEKFEIEFPHKSRSRKKTGNPDNIVNDERKE
jgi:glutathione synthase/RimK-type ligase-like ATP-grasp enzyme